MSVILVQSGVTETHTHRVGAATDMAVAAPRAARPSTFPNAGEIAWYGMISAPVAARQSE